MIKIIKAEAAADAGLRLVFSDGSVGELDLSPLIARNTSLTAPLADENFRRACYVELGALCWPNGLELSGESLYRRLKVEGKLQAAEKAA